MNSKAPKNFERNRDFLHCTNGSLLQFSTWQFFFSRYTGIFMPQFIYISSLKNVSLTFQTKKNTGRSSPLLRQTLALINICPQRKIGKQQKEHKTINRHAKVGPQNWRALRLQRCVIIIIRRASWKPAWNDGAAVIEEHQVAHRIARPEKARALKRERETEEMPFETKQMISNGCLIKKARPSIRRFPGL